MTWYLNFQLYILYSVKSGIRIFTGCGLCQDTILTYKLSIYVQNMYTKFQEIQGPVKCFLLVEVDMFSVFTYYGLEKETTIFFDIECHDSYLKKCLHNNITQNHTIW